MAGARRHILLMTATITPENSPELARVDPATRLADYHAALAFYLGLVGAAIDGIVFVENSDSDIASLRALAAASPHGDAVEFIANYGQFRYPGRDRSYGEFKLLDHAMATSRMIAAAGEDAIVWKITGRYQVRNLARMIRQAPRHFDLYCDMRDRPVRWMDLRLMAWTRHGYREVFAGITDTLPTEPREPVMRDYVPTRAGRARIVPRYRTEPLVAGVRGWDNRAYDKGSAMLKFYVRAISRRTLPFLWI